jgi:hypothetical protein
MEHGNTAFSAPQQMRKAKKEIHLDIKGKCIATYANQSNNDSESNITQYNEELQHYDNIAFEFSLPRGDVMGRLIDDLAHEEDKDAPLWFSGVINTHTGKVINATIGRRTAYHQAA